MSDRFTPDALANAGDTALDRALADLSPAPARDDAALARVHSRLTVHMGASGNHDQPPASRLVRVAETVVTEPLADRTPFWSRRRLVGAGATLAVATAVATAVTLPHGSAPATSDATAGASNGTAHVLSAKLVADEAAQKVLAAHPSGSGAYTKITITRHDHAADGSGDGPARVATTWVPADASSTTAQWYSQRGTQSGSGSVVVELSTSGYCNNLFSDTGDGTYAGAKAPGGSNATASCNRAGSFTDLSPKFVAGLEGQSDSQLRQTLAAASRRSARGSAFSTNSFGLVASLLESGLPSQHLTARLYRLLGATDGVTAQANVDNGAGQRGTGLTVSDSRSSTTVILDSNGQLIGEVSRVAPDTSVANDKGVESTATVAIESYVQPPAPQK